MYTVGLDADTRAYFTAATSATSLFIILSVNTPSKFFPLKISNNILVYKNNCLNSNKKSIINHSDKLFIENKTGSVSPSHPLKGMWRTNGGTTPRPKAQGVVPTGTSLILFNGEKLSLNIQKGILTKIARDFIQMTPFQCSIIVGLILSDGWIQYRKTWNPRIGFKQSIKNFEYFWYVFIQLSTLCSGYPWLASTMKRGKLFYSLEFNTRQLKCFNEVYTLFFSDSKIKVIKPELYDYLDYVAIAHWIMGDAAKRNKGITLCTDCFSYKEVVLLMNILKIKYNINSTIHKEKHKPRIYINNKELLKILPYIKPYFTKNFLYKISL
jgi:hypothetical protein